jgi:hypothetical protein
MEKGSVKLRSTREMAGGDMAIRADPGVHNEAVIRDAAQGEGRPDARTILLQQLAERWSGCARRRRWRH